MASMILIYRGGREEALVTQFLYNRTIIFKVQTNILRQNKMEEREGRNCLQTIFNTRLYGISKKGGGTKMYPQQLIKKFGKIFYIRKYCIKICLRIHEFVLLKSLFCFSKTVGLRSEIMNNGANLHITKFQMEYN